MSGYDPSDHLGELTDRLAALPDDAWAPPTPPALAPLPDPERRPRRRMLTLRPGLALASAIGLVGAGIAGGIAFQRSQGAGPSDPVRTLALAPLTLAGRGAGGTVQFVSSAKSPRVRVMVHGLKPTGGSQSYEVWLMNSATNLVSVGGFQVGADGNGTFEATLPRSTTGFRLVDLSLEPNDGNPAHSSKSFLRAQL